MKSIHILNVFSGVALFLFGMNLMSDHIKKITGSTSEMMLFRLTDKPFKAIAVGTAVTAIIQSSSAVSAMVVGLVEGNVIQLKKAIAIILGTILGTAATGWIIAYSSLGFVSPISAMLSAGVISSVFAIIGIIFKLFLKNKTIQRIGETMLGFSVLMLGISTISAAVEPLKESPFFLEIVASFKNPILLLCIGIIFSALLQSASAAIGIVQTVSMTGLINFNTALFLILGIGVGASLPVLLTAIGKKTDAKRAAFSYLFANVFGAVIFTLLGIIFIKIFNTQAVIMTPVSIALLNTAYRFAMVIILMGLLSKIEWLCISLINTKRRGTRKAVRSQ